MRISGAVFAAVLVGAATGWPVGALLAGVAAFAIPALLREDRAHAALVARVEAIAGWAEMLRDTIAAAAGLEQAIAATAPLAPPPIRDEVVMLAARLERERLSTALRAFADDVADPTCDLVVAALVLASEHQAHRLGELLGSPPPSRSGNDGLELKPVAPPVRRSGDRRRHHRFAAALRR